MIKVTNPYNQNQNLLVKQTQVYKKVTNTILEWTSDTSHVLFYALLIWIVIYSFLDEHDHISHPAYELSFVTSPETNHLIN